MIKIKSTLFCVNPAHVFGHDCLLKPSTKQRRKTSYRVFQNQIARASLILQAWPYVLQFFAT